MTLRAAKRYPADEFIAHITQSLQLGQVVQTWQPGQPGQLDLGQLAPAAISTAAQEVLGNPIYRQNVCRLQTAIHASPDQGYAVRLVERVAAEHEAVLNMDLMATYDSETG